MTTKRAIELLEIEKVIKGLEFCTQHGSMCGSDCNSHYERYTNDGHVIKLVDEYRSKCPYGKCETGCVKTLAKDALELLKEQEPVIVRQREMMHMLFWCCGSCGVPITEGDKFCRMCGRAVKWNGKRRIHKRIQTKAWNLKEKL